MSDFDAYARQAQLKPGLLAMLPVSVVAVALGLRDIPIVSAIAALVVAAGGSVLLAETVRKRGKKLEERLYAKWGGAPTTQLLRLTGDPQNRLQQERWRTALAENAQVPLPSLDDEAADPRSCDERYEVMTAWARTQMTDVDLVQHENRSYGFNRNMLGMKPIGLALSVLAVVVLAVAALVGEPTVLPVLAGLAACVGLVACWTLWPTEDRVRDAGMRYARQLFISATGS